MRGEFDFFGVLVPSLMVWGLVAFLVSLPLRRLLAAVGFYRLVWHRALFDLALLVVLWAGVAWAAAAFATSPFAAAPLAWSRA
jgi:hypothetical protein